VFFQDIFTYVFKNRVILFVHDPYRRTILVDTENGNEHLKDTLKSFPADVGFEVLTAVIVKSSVF
jgi:hypothetical protein